MNLRHINYMYFISYCIFLSDFRLQIVKDTYMKDHLFRRSDLLPPNIIKHETNTFSQHIEIKYLSWEKYNISLICVLATLLHRMITREQQFAFFSFNIML